MTGPAVSSTGEGKDRCIGTVPTPDPARNFLPAHVSVDSEWQRWRDLATREGTNSNMLKLSKRGDGLGCPHGRGETLGCHPSSATPSQEPSANSPLPSTKIVTQRPLSKTRIAGGRVIDQASRMLLAGNSCIKKTHYEVLSVNEDASYDEIRANYRAAVLNSHPDKLCVQKPGALELHHDLQERFLDVQKAWEVLCDSVSRANYDNELRSSREEPEVLANEVKLGEMMVETVGDVQELLYQCRCGDYFSVTLSELGEMGVCLNGKGEAELQKSTALAPASVLIPCGSCSLKILLILDI